MSKRRSATVLLLCLTASTVGAHSSPCAEAQVQLRTLASALDVYEIKHGSYPRSEGWMATLKKAGILVAEFPESDRWGHRYFYQPSANGNFDLRSVGPDGTWGTGDDQARSDDWKWKDCKARSGC